MLAHTTDMLHICFSIFATPVGIILRRGAVVLQEDPTCRHRDVLLGSCHHYLSHYLSLACEGSITQGAIDTSTQQTEILQTVQRLRISHLLYFKSRNQLQRILKERNSFGLLLFWLLDLGAYALQLVYKG